MSTTSAKKLNPEGKTNGLNIKVGDTVYLLPTYTGNAYRNNKNYITAKVTKVGRKIFETNLRHKFFIENGREKTDYSPDYTAFDNMQNLQLAKDGLELPIWLRNTTFTTEQLRKFKEIYDSTK